MDDLDAAIAVVYSQAPSAFVAARSALVKELRAAKRRDEAARVAALRRPTKLAWALGEAVRRAPEAADAYFEAIAALAERGGDLRQRTTDLRIAVAGLVGGAEGADPGEAGAALLATAADPDAATGLRLGRLAEVPAAGGFGLTAFEDLAAAGPGPGPGPGEGAHGERPAPEEAAPSTTGGTPGHGAPSEGVQEAARAEAADRVRHEEERARADGLAALESEAGAAEAVEAVAAAEVEAAQAALTTAQAELERVSAALATARERTAAVRERVRAAGGITGG